MSYSVAKCFICIIFHLCLIFILWSASLVHVVASTCNNTKSCFVRGFRFDCFTEIRLYEVSFAFICLQYYFSCVNLCVSRYFVYILWYKIKHQHAHGSGTHALQSWRTTYLYLGFCVRFQYEVPDLCAARYFVNCVYFVSCYKIKPDMMANDVKSQKCNPSRS
jgi:hypothetical protein